MEPNGLSLAEIRFFSLEVRREENLRSRGSSYRWRIVERFSWLEKMASA
jgi:hypothetical protein